MILIDTSVWIDHLRAGDDAVTALLASGQVLMHPFVIGELALGNLRQRDLILAYLQDLPHAIVGADNEVLHFIEANALAGLGVGYVDTHLLASTRLTAGARIRTRDKRLMGVAEKMDLDSFAG